MVSLAFVISFTVSAVAMLLGIAIYADITDAMALTIPTLDEDGITLLGQNGNGTDQPIPTGTANLASIYTGLDSFDKAVGVSVPISGVIVGGGGGFNVTSFTTPVALNSFGAPIDTSSIYLMPNGNILYIDEMFSGSETFSTSIDGGLTFSAFAEITPSHLTKYAGLDFPPYQDDNGKVYHLYTTGDTGTPLAPFTASLGITSTIDGLTWTTPVETDMPTGMCEYWYSMYASGSTVTIQASTCNLDDSVSSSVIKSTDGGATFGSPIIVIDDTSPYGFLYQNIMAGSGANLTIISNADDIGGKGSQFYTIASSSSDGGSTWTDPQKISRNDTGSVPIPYFTSLDGGAEIHVSGNKVLAIYPTQEQSVYTVTSLDGGVTWSAPFLLVNASLTPDVCGDNRNVMIDRAGNTESLFLVCTSFAGDIVVRSTTDFGATWTGYEVVQSNVGINASMVGVTCTENNIYILFAQDTGVFDQDDLNLIISNDQGATFSSIVEVVNEGLETQGQGELSGFVFGTDTELYVVFREMAGEMFFTKGIGTAIAGSGLPAPYMIGIYDSGNNLIDSYTDSVTVDTPQDLIATLNINSIPNDGIIQVVIFGEGINYLGDTTTADFDSGVAGLPLAFVSDGTSASSQRTILHIFHPAQNSNDVLGQNDTFETTKNIGFTVLGVLPVALFFGLFTILSPRVDGEQ